MYILSNILDLENYKRKYAQNVIKSISHDYPDDFNKDEIEDWGLFAPPRSFFNKYYSNEWTLNDLRKHYADYLEKTWPTYCYLGGSVSHLNVILVVPNTIEYEVIGRDFVDFLHRNGFATEADL